MKALQEGGAIRKSRPKDRTLGLWSYDRSRIDTPLPFITFI